MNESQIWLRRLLLILGLVLIFEGVCRKFVGSGLATLIFVLKDMLVFLMALLLMSSKLSAPTSKLAEGYGFLIFFLLLPFVLTLTKDAKLAVFGLKQYALFPIVALAFPTAFKNASQTDITRFFKVMAWMLVPVTLVAIMQLKLGPNHRLNRSVGGDELSGFAAAGRLRVSSTFAFVAQYGMYLNACLYLLGGFIFLRVKKGIGLLDAPSIMLCICLIVGTFITGSRSAVIGNGAILVVACALLFMKGNAKASGTFIGILIIGGLSFLLAQKFFPTAFEAYTARSTGTAEHSHEEEVQNRVVEMLTHWTYGIEGAPPTLMGYGLGVMSNGSEKVSSYAASWRQTGLWGETDMANTLFEGGWYLIVTWMLMRILVIAFVFQKVLSFKDPKLFVVGSLTAGYVAVQGVFGTLGIQPPLAIWFWFAVGIVITLKELDDRTAALAEMKELAAHPNPHFKQTVPKLQPRKNLPAKKMPTVTRRAPTRVKPPQE